MRYIADSRAKTALKSFSALWGGKGSGADYLKEIKSLLTGFIQGKESTENRGE
jgi:hypothetical protein